MPSLLCVDAARSAGNQKVALVIDDVPSFEPFVARGIRVYGCADGPIDRVGMVGLPIGEQGFEPTRTRHSPLSEG